MSPWYLCVGENHVSEQYYLHISKKSSNFVADLEEMINCYRLW